MSLGPWFRLGLGVALVALVLDQVTKWWIVHVYELPERGRVAVTPFFDLVMLWNPGISYGLLAQNTDFGRNVLIALAVVAAVVLTVWIARTHNRLLAISLGLIVGGAIGNAVDRAVYGAVADFISLHAYGYYWYVFNIADAAIAVGVIGLLYDTVAPGHKIDAKRSDSSSN
ncbi:signal peptidase II [Dichotomicrobium thermohalophilum]|uniref:Lipoprotein signal peptidase n=1 Tax=Dichotomicrobium thermohalophilum TaxID=933063 RepID=A0A397PJC8_9HYPH|nr:signal peptidase II [Dichotomicrobium thermohalophilum]RIA47385.1 signal peptidase II [Dichotomicrobium thermohalophilum]